VRWRLLVRTSWPHTHTPSLYLSLSARAHRWRSGQQQRVQLCDVGQQQRVARTEAVVTFANCNVLHTEMVVILAYSNALVQRDDLTVWHTLQPFCASSQPAHTHARVAHTVVAKHTQIIFDAYSQPTRTRPPKRAIHRALDLLLYL
jgi:hypothetical protein